MDLVQHTVLLLPPNRQQDIQFKEMRPSKHWIKGFIGRNPELQVKTMRAIEDKRTAAVTMPAIAEHISRLQAAMKRYSIKDASRIFNIDESGASFRKMRDYRATEGGHKILLLLDGYASHIQYEVLKLFKDNHVIVIGMPAHTSHVLQPLDVSVFSSYKSKLQREIHDRGKHKKVLDGFDIADAITIAYTESLNAVNITSGFRRCGVWDPSTLTASIEPLERLPFSDISNLTPNGKQKLPTLQNVIQSFSGKSRSLLFDADVEERGTIKVKTTTGANLHWKVQLPDFDGKSYLKKIRRNVRAANACGSRTAA